MGLLENLAARSAGEDVVAEREEEVGVGRDAGFGARNGLIPIRVGLR